MTSNKTPRQMWIFSSTSGEVNEYGQEIIDSFVRVNNSTLEYPDPNFEDIFSRFWAKYKDSLPYRERKVRGMRGSYMTQFTRADWRRRARHFLKSRLEREADQVGGTLCERVRGLLLMPYSMRAVGPVISERTSIFEGETNA